MTVMVTSTGLDSFPPQSVATTERTWDLDSLPENNNQNAGKDQDHELDLKQQKAAFEELDQDHLNTCV